MLHTATLFQENWQIDYSAKGKQGIVTMRSVLVRRRSVKGMLKYM